VNGGTSEAESVGVGGKLRSMDAVMAAALVAPFAPIAPVVAFS